MKSTIDPRYEILEDGTWVQEFYSPFTQEVKEVYPPRLAITVGADVYHFLNMMPALPIELKLTHYDICYAFGGGLPKFESYLNIDKIVVIDWMPEVYEPFLKEFIEKYKFTQELEFIQDIFTADSIAELNYDKTIKTLFTFIHVLEHQSLNDHIDILKKLPKNVDVLVYGPNVTKCKNKGWIHIGPWLLDHNTLIPYKRMVEIIQRFGYQIYFSMEYSDDLLIYFRT